MAISLPRELKQLSLVLTGRYQFQGEFLLRMLKSKYGNDFDDMYNDMPVLIPYDESLRWVWNALEVIDVIEIINHVDDTEKRRAIFEYLPTAMMFNDEDECVHDCVVQTTQQDLEGNVRVIDNRYRLLRKKAKVLFPNRNLNTEYIYAVEVRCVTTNKVYRLLLPIGAEFCKPGKYDAAAAVAWTMRCPITNPHSLVRQGEKLNWIGNEDSKLLPPDQRRHLTKEEYFKYLGFQS